MVIYLHNSLTRSKELFTPIDGAHVRMYVCGPTVYDRPHLGNARSAVVYDVLYRLLRNVYPQVTYVRNITDVDDKIIKACLDGNIEAAALTVGMAECYHEDVGALNCLPPTVEPRATQYIAQMIEMIERLLARGNAYEAEGHVLFAVNSYGEYGKLSGRSWEEMIAGARVEVAPYKRSPADFVLWKPSPAGEEAFGFESPWGQGRPGWHIECSAMTRSILGEHFDIHGGGVDLTFPHHENEIAQSECSSASGKFANYWVHNGFLMVGGEKMSKSLGNFYTVREVLDARVEGCVIRCFYLGTHYRKPIDFNAKALEDAAKTVERFRAALVGVEVSGDTVDISECLACLADDLNTPLYLAKMHEYASKYLAEGDKLAQRRLLAACELVGLDLRVVEAIVPEEVQEWARLRQEARAAKDWALADSLRGRIVAAGYAIKEDKDGGYVVTLNRSRLGGVCLHPLDPEPSS